METKNAQKPQNTVNLKTNDVVGRRLELARQSEALMKAFIFAPKNKRGRPSNRSRSGRPRAVDVATLLKLEHAFSIGCSVDEAVAYADISVNSYYEFIKLNPTYSERVSRLKQLPTVVARNSVTSGMKNSGELALKYLERKLPEEFSLKAVVQHNVEFTGISLEKPRQSVELITERSTATIEEIEPIEADTTA
jgi:hypothetical protein